MRVLTCKELRVKHNQTSCYLRPPPLGTRLAPSRTEALCRSTAHQAARRGWTPEVREHAPLIREPENHYHK